MKGGSLTRFRPDTQGGGGFWGDLLSSSLQSGMKAFKSGRGIRDRIRKAGVGVKRGAKRAVKRKALQVVERNVKRKLNDIFGE